MIPIERRFFDWAYRTSQYVAEKFPECDEIAVKCRWTWNGKPFLSPTTCRCSLVFRVNDTLLLRRVALPELIRLLSLFSDKSAVTLSSNNMLYLEVVLPAALVKHLSSVSFRPGGWVIHPGERPFEERFR